MLTEHFALSQNLIHEGGLPVVDMRDDGDITDGGDIGYFEQEQRRFEASGSVLETLWAVEPNWTEGAIRKFLASFFFRGDDVYKVLHQLSGGERSRLALATLVMERSNVLILDEPTNHLDLESRVVMEKALRAFRGTIVVATHDRALLQGFVDKIFDMRADGFYEWPDYQSFQADRTRKHEGHGVPAKTPQKRTEKPRKESKDQHQAAKKRKSEENKLRKRVERAENAVTDADSLKESLLNQMAEPEVAVDPEKMADLAKRLSGAERQSETSVQEWERLSSRLEAFLDQDS